MTASLVRIGYDDVNERSLLLLHAVSTADLPGAIVVGAKYFTSLVACDARMMTTGEVAALARVLLDAGCVYFCCWGPDCERVHDIIDETYLEKAGISIHDDASTIMTTWHNEESLGEAAWFALNAALPDDRFIGECRAVVAACIGDSLLSNSVRAALTDPRSPAKCAI
jgi:hypothetical protein